jgi:hypothetical protein
MATLEECDITQTEHISGGLHFACNQCGYKVALSSFDPKDGNVRTEAATAVTQHAAANHSIIRPVASRTVEENSSNTQRGELLNSPRRNLTFSGAFQGPRYL